MASIAAIHHFSHPWFDKPSMKRRHSSSSPEDEAPLNVSPTSAKRRRVTALERGFSNLSLHHVQPGASTSTSFIAPTSYPDSGSIPPPSYLIHTTALSSSSPPLSDTLTAMEVEYSSMTPSIQPDSVEEPPSPSLLLPEIQMKKSSSWYEPEPDRIVVTDLDSSDDEDEAELVNPVVSPTLLERIRQRELFNTVPVPSLPNQQALVLYRPLTRPSTYTEPEDDQLDISPDQEIVLDASSSVQDVEMMDVE
ncbi:hypothetical protein GGU10DRAFT_337584 [Lentinula aff. detonsa]|uniref:Uncharacterized protein n=1 Tax=Lentinula aff. detonsa TaxID=2804958 RepID=A0AA38KCY4_9AGAR|nr:hypothetical protein GGU10DRAFT_337584 [Lentinula aff. detonsa]